MSLLKKNGGFTLVELIVVIAILAILAGVAVPAYSGYVEKANKQADITLVREAANALILHHYANSEAGPLVVVLNPEGTAASADGESAKAMEAVFGADWANSVGLKYDGWNGASNMAAVNNSNYMQTGTISEKMQDVQSLANKATDFLNLKQGNPENMYNKLGLYLGDGFYDFCADNGITSADGKFTNASSEQLTNLMGLYVAEDMSNVDEGFYDLVLEDAMLGKGLNTTTATESVNQTTYLAAKYAMFCSIAAGTGEAGQARLDAVDAALGEATNVGQVESALGKFFEDWSSDADFMASVENYYANDFAADTQAISSIMGVASDQAKNYYEDATDLDTGDFFTSPSVTAGLNSYMSAAQQLGSLNVGAGAVVLYTDGVTPHVVVTPSDAYLID